MRRECTIKVTEYNGIPTIEIHGDLSADAQRDMDTVQREVCNRNSSQILVKFDGRSRVNSAGIAILLNLVIDSRGRGCKVYLTGMLDHFRKIFRMVGLTRYAEIVESVDEIAAEEAD